jgi:hypothetical protein
MLFDPTKHPSVMKRMKINAALLAMVLGATAAFAFKAPVHHARFANAFWQYNGGNATSASSYTKLDAQPDCQATTNLCAIEAPVASNPSQPVISTSLAQRINTHDQSMGDVFLKD